MRVLLVKTSSLGDVIHNLPVASDLARRFPGVIIDWVVEESFADIPALHPAVATIHPVALRRWKTAPLAAATRHEIRAFRTALKAQSYDLILDTQGLVKSAWITRHAIGPKAGYNRRSIREPLACLAYDRRFAIDRALHAVERNRRLAAAAFGYSIDDPDLPLDYGLDYLGVLEDEQSARHHLQKKATSAAQACSADSTEPGDSGEAILLTATSRDDKLWEESRWVELGRSLAGQGRHCVLPAGSALERERARRIAAQIPHAQVLPPLGIRELASRIAHAHCAIGVDTGLTHLAAATGIPTVALYTATDPGLTGVVGTRFFKNLGGKKTSPPVSAVLDALAEAEAESITQPPALANTPATCKT